MKKVVSKTLMKFTVFVKAKKKYKIKVINGSLLWYVSFMVNRGKTQCVHMFIGI